MKKSIATILAALVLSGCQSVPDDMKDRQKDERQKLRTFHVVERKVHHSEKAAIAAGGVTAAAAANLAAQKIDLYKAKQDLNFGDTPDASGDYDELF
ncbi:membrane lipoprotein lipid attachment site-containing protein [Thaumasiovibrio sp. DFM-14]|uniref:membrane lipoprotein lipid attachment site-containing protein n=1 Tax=Thaumasiovibrio sp. DFM-14 TaxID=3384792 RepID=UPI0039A038D9